MILNGVLTENFSAEQEPPQVRISRSTVYQIEFTEFIKLSLITRFSADSTGISLPLRLSIDLPKFDQHNGLLTVY